MDRATAFSILVFTAMLSWLVSPAAAEKRVALVIGNSAYQHTQSLDNPRNDARLIAEVLKSRGFEVDLKLDLAHKDMKRAIRSFTSRLEKYGKDTAGLFYYAGHGLQSNGVNFLVPVDAQIAKEGDIEIETIASRGLLSGMQFAGNRLNIIILDACRNNPYQGFYRSGDRGLARMDAPVGSLVAFSTSPGTVAADGAGQNSPYTAALAKAMSEPGLKIEDVFKKVRQTVYAATSGQQIPWESTSIFGDFFFTAPLPKETTEQPDANIVERAHWDAIQHLQTPAPFEAYLLKYPRGLFAEEARQKITALEARERRRHEAEKRTQADAVERLKAAERARNRLHAERERMARERDEFAKQLEELERRAQAKAKETAAKKEEQVSSAATDSKRLAEERDQYLARLEALEARAEKLAAQVEANAEERRVASLATKSEAAAAEAPSSDMDATELALVLQAELKRVGCDPGPLDGHWGGKSRSALTRFAAYAKIKLASLDPSPKVLEVLKQREDRVCPVQALKPKPAPVSRSKPTTARTKKSSPAKKSAGRDTGKCGSGPCTSTATFPSGKRVIIQTVPNAVANW